MVWEVPSSSDPLAGNSDTPNSDQWDTMTFKVSGKYTGESSPQSQVVWADQDTSAAKPRLGSAPGSLPAFLVQTHDHDKYFIWYSTTLGAKLGAVIFKIPVQGPRMERAQGTRWSTARGLHVYFQLSTGSLSTLG